MVVLHRLLRKRKLRKRLKRRLSRNRRSVHLKIVVHLNLKRAKEVFPNHGAARAVGGCAIYVSDKPGHHDFNLLKKLMLPDGSTLRAKLQGRSTRDCLFADPTRDGKSLLKIWNLNNFMGVVGVFNCQGAGWCKEGIKILIHDEHPSTITGIIRAKDVNYLPKVTDSKWDGDAVVYSHLGGIRVKREKTSLYIEEMSARGKPNCKTKHSENSLLCATRQNQIQSS